MNTSTNSFWDQSKNLFLAYIQLIGFYFIFFILLGIIQQVFPGIDLTKYSQKDLMQLIEKEKLHAFFSLILIAPIIEESMFRTLLRPSSKELTLWGSTWIVSILWGVLPKMSWYYSYPLLLISISLVFFILSLLISKKILRKACAFLSQKEIWILQITAVVFGLFHIVNYVDSFLLDSALFLLIVPRIIAGHVFGTLKIKNRHIIWPITLHAMNNGIIYLLFILRS
ncbi:type II CAAX prenyl endopeptidase Rce1 family protein [Aquimarina hainanensis]|uniref:Type II CAAX prenyl endopeptidase Rce1 family protein n=1 Tax=Aquimarina hainanensis TaxID=1578017 RepID=A0ABW5NG58_9FLAO